MNAVNTVKNQGALTRPLSTQLMMLLSQAAQLALLLVPAAQAGERIPQESGYSGYVNLGTGITNVKSNTISEFSTIDFENDTINNLGSPDGSETAITPIVGMELAYTFGDSGTQVFLGNSLEDYISFDFATRAGIRQDVGDWGIVGVSYLRTSVAAEVWEDPFAVGCERASTDRTGNGYRLIWDKVMDTELELTFSKRSIDIDDERSGKGLNLSSAEQEQLNRNGDNLRMTAKYTFADNSKQHVLSPEMFYTKQDRQGDAVSNTGVGINLNYVYTLNRWNFVVNTNIAKVDYDEANPVFKQKADSKRYGASFTAFYKEPLGMKDWYLNTGVVWYEENSDINFYDSSIRQYSLGMMYRF